MKSIVNALIFMSILSACSDGNDFSGITETDYLGNVLSIDSSDWNGRTSALIPSVNPPHSPGFGPAFPNPAIDSVTFIFGIPYNSKVKITLSNNQSTIKTITDRSYPAGYHTIKCGLYSDKGIKLSPGVYRCKYIFKESDEVSPTYYSGYGDIKITQ